MNSVTWICDSCAVTTMPTCSEMASGCFDGILLDLMDECEVSFLRDLFWLFPSIYFPFVTRIRNAMSVFVK